MLELKNITKIYKSKKKEEVKAIDNVSLSFPDNGFIFIVGKSGSGKSTLLSLIGTLENLTSGDIIIDGTHINTLSNENYAYYRNSKIGYIFQDFHLIDDLTIYENIALSLKLQGIEDENKVKEILKNVDLEGYESRFPKELSGGEKQRIAIARAMVKNPSVILADEPTGNLDEKTTKQIMDLLHEISKTKLVLIVSHNKYDAKKYADRIIELQDGKIINDLMRNEAFNENIEVIDDTLFIPLNKELNSNDEQKIDTSLNEQKIKHIKIKDNRFVPTKIKNNANKQSEPFKKSNLSIKESLKLGWRFLKKNIGVSILYALIIAMFISIINITELVSHFDSSHLINEQLSNSNLESIPLMKNKYKVDNSYEPTINNVMMSEEDKKTILDTGYKGHIFELYNIDRVHYRLPRVPETQKLYHTASNGVLVCTEDYLKSIYGNENGELEFVCKASEQKDYGYYITDYYADFLLDTTPYYYSSYEEVVGKGNHDNYNHYGYYNAIINTHYKERHKVALDKIKDLTNNDDLTKDKDVIRFYDEINQFLNIGYSFDPNFKETFINSECQMYTFSRFYGYKAKIGDEIKLNQRIGVSQNNLKDNEIELSLTSINSMLGTNYTKEEAASLLPFDLDINVYDVNDTKYETIIKAIPCKVVRLSEVRHVSVSQNVLKEIQEVDLFPYMYYLDDLSNIKEVYDATSKIGMVPLSNYILPLVKITDSISSFSSLFNLMFWVLMISSIGVLVSYNLKSIKERMYEIGIIKSLGGTNTSLMHIFGLHTIVMLGLTIIFYLIGVNILVPMANNLLSTSLIKASRDILIDKDLILLSVKGSLLLINSSIIIIMSLVAIIIPVIKLRNIKPMNIIKAKE